jgi:hypothetical protein
MQPMNPLIQFTKLVEANPALQSEIFGTEKPAQIVALAKSNGCVFSLETLRAVSRDLSAPYWPWASRGHTWRRSYFNQT